MEGADVLLKKEIERANVKLMDYFVSLNQKGYSKNVLRGTGIYAGLNLVFSSFYKSFGKAITRETRLANRELKASQSKIYILNNGWFVAVNSTTQTVLVASTSEIKKSIKEVLRVHFIGFYPPYMGKSSDFDVYSFLTGNLDTQKYNLTNNDLAVKSSTNLTYETASSELAKSKVEVYKQYESNDSYLNNLKTVVSGLVHNKDVLKSLLKSDFDLIKTLTNKEASLDSNFIANLNSLVTGYNLTGNYGGINFDLAKSFALPIFASVRDVTVPVKSKVVEYKTMSNLFKIDIDLQTLELLSFDVKGKTIYKKELSVTPRGSFASNGIRIPTTLNSDLKVLFVSTLNELVSLKEGFYLGSFKPSSGVKESMVGLLVSSVAKYIENKTGKDTSELDDVFKEFILADRELSLNGVPVSLDVKKATLTIPSLNLVLYFKVKEFRYYSVRLVQVRELNA